MTERRKLDWRQIVIAICAAVIAALGGGVTTVAWQGCDRRPQPEIPEPPPPKPEPPPPPSPDPIQAIGKLALQGSFCSATVVGPRRPDGRWWIVSAAHCFGGAGTGVKGTFITRAGSPTPVTCVGIDRTSDIAILATDERYESLAHVMVAENTPPPGTTIQHGGFGQHLPGNIEAGQVTQLPNQQGQVRYKLSVSPGDSGGGILMTVGGQLLSPVCCTTCLGCLGDVWGGSPERIRRMMTTPTDFIDLPPAVMPPPPKE